VSDNPFLKYEQEWEDEHKEDEKPEKKGQEIINNTHVYKDFEEGMRTGRVSLGTKATDLIRSLLEEEDKNRSKFFGHEPIFPIERKIQWEPVYSHPDPEAQARIQDKVDEAARELADKADEKLEYMAMKALTGTSLKLNYDLPPFTPVAKDIKFSNREVTADASFAASAFSVAVKKILLKNMRELRIEIDEYIKKLEAEIGGNIGSND
jgi:hypothetical protein